jgi:hypothetical protein
VIFCHSLSPIGVTCLLGLFSIPRSPYRTIFEHKIYDKYCQAALSSDYSDCCILMVILIVLESKRLASPLLAGMPGLNLAPFTTTEKYPSGLQTTATTPWPSTSRWGDLESFFDG